MTYGNNVYHTGDLLKSDDGCLFGIVLRLENDYMLVMASDGLVMKSEYKGWAIAKGSPRPHFIELANLWQALYNSCQMKLEEAVDKILPLKGMDEAVTAVLGLESQVKEVLAKLRGTK